MSEILPARVQTVLQVGSADITSMMVQSHIEGLQKEEADLIATNKGHFQELEAICDEVYGMFAKAFAKKKPVIDALVAALNTLLGGKRPLSRRRSMKSSPTFTEAVGPELLALTNWQRRLGYSDIRSFGSADGTFGDVVSVCKDARLDTLGWSTSLWAYGMLLGDTRTPKAVVSRILRPLTNAFLAMLKSTPITKQNTQDLVQFMDFFNKARLTGRFKGRDKRHIDRVMFVMAANFSAKVNGRDVADYSKPKPAVGVGGKYGRNGYSDYMGNY